MRSIDRMLSLLLHLLLFSLFLSLSLSHFLLFSLHLSISPVFEFPPSMSLNSLATSPALAHEPLAAISPCTNAPTRAACGAVAFPPEMALSLAPT